MSALRQSSHTGVKRFRALFMTSNPCIRKDPGAEEHGVVRATVSMWMAEPQGRAYFLCSLASGSVTHGRHACLLLFPRGFSGCSSEVLFLRPCCSEPGWAASVTQGRLEVETFRPRPDILNPALSTQTPPPRPPHPIHVHVCLRLTAGGRSFHLQRKSNSASMCYVLYKHWGPFCLWLSW